MKHTRHRLPRMNNIALAVQFFLQLAVILLFLSTAIWASLRNEPRTGD